MRLINIKYVWVACLLLFQFVSQAQTSQAKKTVITGSINLNADYLLQVADLLDKQDAQEEPVSSTGEFTMELDMTQPRWVEVSFVPIKKDRQLGATFPLYVLPGEKIDLKLSYSKEAYLQLLSTTIKGEHKALIEYAAFSNSTMRDLFMKRGAPDEYAKAIESYFSEANALVKSNKVKQKDVVAYLKLWSYNNYLGVATTNSKITVPKAIMDAIPTVFDTDMTTSFYNGPNTVNSFIMDLIPAEQDPFKRLELKNAKLNELFKTKSLIRAMLIGDLQRYVSSYQVGDKTQFAADIHSMETLLNTIGDERLKTAVLQDFKNLHNTSVGSEAPNVKFKDLAGNEVTLDQFKGKYVYIDLWASWCVPCIKEIPFLHELEALYKDKNIVFVSISLDDNKTAWRNKVTELKLEGHQWELGESSYDKLMNVTGIPHFLLYNPDGKLMHYKAARPSSAAIKTIFDNI